MSIMNFKISELSSTNSVTLSRPFPAGYYSKCHSQPYVNSLQNLKYINFPGNYRMVKLNLNDGTDISMPLYDVKTEKIDSLLKWLLQEGRAYNHSDFAGFVCLRGILKQIMCTPFEKMEGWFICAIKWNGKIYLCAYETEAQCTRRETCTVREKKCTVWGRKFEQYMTSATPHSRPDTDKIVGLNNDNEFCVVFKSQLNSHRLLYGAEMDGVNSSVEIKSLEDLQNVEFIELKTSKDMRWSQHPDIAWFKSMKWWAQSYLVGISKILCGFRNDKGVVSYVKRVDIGDLLSHTEWDSTKCLNFLDKFLTLVKGVVENDVPGTVWKFEWKPNTDIKCTKVKGLSSELNFLPEWFTCEVN